MAIENRHAHHLGLDAGAQVELGAPFSMISVPHVNQVHLFYRARLHALDFKPGEETLEVALWDEDKIPWKDIAFRTVGLTDGVERWLAAKGGAVFHEGKAIRFHEEEVRPMGREAAGVRGVRLASGRQLHTIAP